MAKKLVSETWNKSQIQNVNLRNQKFGKYEQPPLFELKDLNNCLCLLKKLLNKLAVILQIERLLFPQQLVLYLIYGTSVVLVQILGVLVG